MWFYREPLVRFVGRLIYGGINAIKGSTYILEDILDLLNQPYKEEIII